MPTFADECGGWVAEMAELCKVKPVSLAGHFIDAKWNQEMVQVISVTQSETTVMVQVISLSQGETKKTWCRSFH